MELFSILTLVAVILRVKILTIVYTHVNITVNLKSNKNNFKEKSSPIHLKCYHLRKIR